MERGVSPMSENTMYGKVKWFNVQKAYGFIAPDDGSKDVFVHVNALVGMSELTEGQNVEFEIQKGKNGKNAAANVKPA